MKKSAIYFASALTIASVLASCNASREKPREKEAEIIYPALIVKKQAVTTQLNLPGELEGYFETAIMAKVNGYIRKLHVDIGDHVREGQLLAELEAPELVSQLISSHSEFQASEAVYLNTRSKWIRLRQTNATLGAVSPYDMDLAKAGLASDSLAELAAKAKYEAVRELTNYLNITAPFDGVITERALAPGAFVGPGDKMGLPLLKLKKESRLRLHVAVPEAHLAEVAMGEIVTFQVKSFPDARFNGRITRLAKNLATTTRSEIVEIEIDNADGRLLPGMYATASLPLRREGLSIVLPKDAVATTMERQFVIKITRGHDVEYLDVQKGEDQGENVEVFGTLHAGDTLLTVATDEIKEKSKLRIAVIH